ncbi:hypothetical protein Tco_1009456 [Tanacetum coccineum]
MYVLFQRVVSEEEDWERMLLRQTIEVTERLSQYEAYIAEIKVLGPRLVAVEPLSYMIEIHTQKTDKLNQLREMLAESQVRLRRKWCTDIQNVVVEHPAAKRGFRAI